MRRELLCYHQVPGYQPSEQRQRDADVFRWEQPQEKIIHVVLPPMRLGNRWDRIAILDIAEEAMKYNKQQANIQAQMDIHLPEDTARTRYNQQLRNWW